MPEDDVELSFCDGNGEGDIETIIMQLDSNSVGSCGSMEDVREGAVIPDAEEDAAVREDLRESAVISDAEEGRGNQEHYPKRERSQQFVLDALPTAAEENKDAVPHSVIGTCIERLKYVYSMGLLIFSITIVMAAIFTEQTVATDEYNMHPALAFFVFWFLIVWLAMMEGGQGALVGLQPVNKALYVDTHPVTLKNTALAHKGDNMERFIMGRQLLVVLVVFVTNMVATAVKGASVLGLPTILNQIFLATGVAVILVTIILGQLTAQVNAATCMLDFLNNYFMLFTIYVSLALEMSGLLHSVYLVQIFFAKISSTTIETSLSPRSRIQNIFFWGRVLMSLAILGFSFAVTLSALFQGKTAMWGGVPEAVSVALLFILMAFVGMMDGMQIALFAVVNLPEEELAQHTIAHSNCQLAFSGQNLQAFLIGRQIWVTICMFVVARITSIDVDVSMQDSENIFGVPDGLQVFFNTGLLGAIITTIVGSLIWRIIASSFPVAFLSNPIIYLIIRMCLILEKTGVCSASWVLARLQKPIFNFQPDRVYLERAVPPPDPHCLVGYD